MPDAAVFLSSRVAGLTNSSVFEVPAGYRATTRKGDPWLRWARVGDYAGWYSIGERLPNFGPELSFWEAVLTLATEAGNGKLDAVHCIGPGILSVGGLGVTLVSGYAQALLAECLRADPLNWLGHMGRVIHDSGAWIAPMDNGAVVLTKKGVALSSEDLNWAVRRGDPNAHWLKPQKHVGKSWVTGVARMLRHPRMDQVQVEYCSEHIPKLIAPMQTLIGWPNSGIRDGWMYTPEQRALWCVLMVGAIEDEEQLLIVARDHVEQSPRDARSSLHNIYTKMVGSSHSESFIFRMRNAVARCQDLFGIQIL